jgi:hypothetical protein
MPIIGIITQPSASSIKAAYRPIVFLVRATKTGGAAIPPVVYCDIYFNGVFYKTLAKTQYKVKNPTTTDWQFDIQDACQEVIVKRIEANGGVNIIQAEDLYKTVFCKFRSSGINGSGFIATEGTAPIQGTGSQDPTSGTGTTSNSFYLLNATLQHHHNQELSTHLNHYKTGTWLSNAWPLTHRKEKYKIGSTNTDYFPIFYPGSLSGLKLFYKTKGATSFTDASASSTPIESGGGGGTGGGGTGGGCVPVGVIGSLGDGSVSVAYSQTLTLTGDAPFNIGSIVKPSWMTISILGTSINLTGTPDTSGSSVVVSFIVGNCDGASVANFADTINIAAAPSTDVNISGTITNTPHSVTVNIASSISCNLTFPILVLADDNGSPVEYEADVQVFAGNTAGTESGIAPTGAITCIKPTTAGTGTFIYSDDCGGINYIFTLTITNPC